MYVGPDVSIWTRIVLTNISLVGQQYVGKMKTHTYSANHPLQVLLSLVLGKQLAVGYYCPDVAITSRCPEDTCAGLGHLSDAPLHGLAVNRPVWDLHRLVDERSDLIAAERARQNRLMDVGVPGAEILSPGGGRIEAASMDPPLQLESPADGLLGLWGSAPPRICVLPHHCCTEVSEALPRSESDYRLIFAITEFSHRITGGTNFALATRYCPTTIIHTSLATLLMRRKVTMETGSFSSSSWKRLSTFWRVGSSDARRSCEGPRNLDIGFRHIALIFGGHLVSV